MKRFVVAYVLVILLVSGACALPTRPFSESPPSRPADTANPPAPTYQEAPAIISRESDGDTVHVNLVKFVGSVSSANTTVIVNNTPAIVNPDGTYYAYLDLLQGQNTIQVLTAQGSDVTTENITLRFIPPLAVYLDPPDIDRDVDYRGKLLKFSGRVSDPKATVTINSKPVILAADGTISNPDATLSVNTVVVGDDGSFSAQVPPGYVQAVATLGQQVDTDWWQLLLSADGGVGTAPGQSLMKGTNSRLSDNEVTITAGQIANVNLILHARKDVDRWGRVPVECNVDVVHVDDSQATLSEPGVSPTVSTLSGLVVEAEPRSFRVYPNINYSPSINVKTSLDMKPGTYQFQVALTSPTMTISSAPLTVNVK